MPKQHGIALEPKERLGLEQLVKTGTRSAQTQRRARALLLADENLPEGGWTDLTIAEALGVSVPTVERARREYHQRGQASLERKVRRVGPRPRKLDARQEARMIALCCVRSLLMATHAGACACWPTNLWNSKWSMPSAMRQSAKPCTATRSNHGRRSTGAFPPKSNAEFVCAMEDVLEVYHRPEDPKRPLICLDEASVQLLGEVREPLPMRPGAPLCVDSEP